jgi:hypothetical protein
MAVLSVGILHTSLYVWGMEVVDFISLYSLYKDDWEESDFVIKYSQDKTL